MIIDHANQVKPIGWASFLWTVHCGWCMSYSLETMPPYVYEDGQYYKWSGNTGNAEAVKQNIGIASSEFRKSNCVELTWFYNCEETIRREPRKSFSLFSFSKASWYRPSLYSQCCVADNITDSGLWVYASNFGILDLDCVTSERFSYESKWDIGIYQCTPVCFLDWRYRVWLWELSHLP